MKFKSFKQFLREEVSENYNGFVETTVLTNQIDQIKANNYLTDQYNYSGILYRVIFRSKGEIDTFKREGNYDQSAIMTAISKLMNPNRYVFFLKSLEDVKAFIEFPGLFKIEEDQVGIIFSIKPKASIDLTIYTGDNEKVIERLEATEEVLSFEDLTINKIDGFYIFEQEGGWQLKTSLNASDTESEDGEDAGKKDDIGSEKDIAEKHGSFKKKDDEGVDKEEHKKVKSNIKEPKI